MTALGVVVAAVLATVGVVATGIGVYRPPVLAARRDNRERVEALGDDLACGGLDPSVLVPGDRS